MGFPPSGSPLPPWVGPGWLGGSLRGSDRFFLEWDRCAFEAGWKSASLGDYSGIAASPNGGVAALWTDMSLQVCFTVRCGAGLDAFYASAL